jgi:hypothetical protein
MADAGHSGSSRSLAIYGVLLELYPREYLQQHRAEMLQNFEDLERASSSQVALWLFIARDLAISLGGRFTRTLSGQTTLVLMVLAILIVETSRYPGKHEYLVIASCCGYLLGWFTGWFGKHWQILSVGRARGYFRSFSRQATALVGVIGLALATARVYPGEYQHFVWVICYGCFIGSIAGWLGKRRQARNSGL